MVSTASKLTLLTKEHFVPRDYKNGRDQSQSCLLHFTETPLSQHFAIKWAVSQMCSIFWARQSQSNNKLQSNIDYSYTLCVLQACFREGLWLKFAEIPGCVSIPWQHDVTVPSCGSASAAYSIHASITTHLRERTAVCPYYACFFNRPEVYNRSKMGVFPGLVQQPIFFLCFPTND